ncbi:hypothetical protein LG296_20475 (plasmid) [Ureibacillus chungkukjangi]|uniref:hypothetical protein n=1 Tax=Ureibacillus chungkukjangi TaxID=1202712 RepID=UPI000D348A74|nr:hypothetical protein [Ureibacillus chungkukjangi]MCM3390424.1 hypothetical protein [Ureibacillus chungkukjangi]
MGEIQKLAICHKCHVRIVSGQSYTRYRNGFYHDSCFALHISEFNLSEFMVSDIMIDDDNIGDVDVDVDVDDCYDDNLSRFI